MAHWPQFEFQGTIFNLTHLDPFEHTYIQPSQKGKPARTYRVWIRFGHHCFTSGKKSNDDPALEYSVVKHDPRTFDQNRYELSKLLPDIVRNLLNKKVFHTGHGNFFTMEIIQPNNQRIEYEIYFELSRASGDKRLHCVITSAFPRDISKSSNRSKSSPIGFAVILHNVLTNKSIRMHKI